VTAETANSIADGSLAKGPDAFPATYFNSADLPTPGGPTGACDRLNQRS
jgi:hypothetical protein